MIYLSSSELLEVVLGEAAGGGDAPVVRFEYQDFYTDSDIVSQLVSGIGVPTPGRAVTSGTTPVTVVTAPASGRVRQVKVSVTNLDDRDHRTIFKTNASGTRTPLTAANVPVYSTLSDQGDGFRVDPDPNATVGPAGPAGPGGVGSITSEVVTGTVDGSNPTFTLSDTPAMLLLFKNGVLQRAGSGNDYTISADTITFLTGAIPLTGDQLWAAYTV